MCDILLLNEDLQNDLKIINDDDDLQKIEYEEKYVESNKLYNLSHINIFTVTRNSQNIDIDVWNLYLTIDRSKLEDDKLDFDIDDWKNLLKDYRITISIIHNKNGEYSKYGEYKQFMFDFEENFIISHLFDDFLEIDNDKISVPLSVFKMLCRDVKFPLHKNAHTIQIAINCDNIFNRLYYYSSKSEVKKHLLNENYSEYGIGRNINRYTMNVVTMDKFNRFSISRDDDILSCKIRTNYVTALMIFFVFQRGPDEKMFNNKYLTTAASLAKYREKKLDDSYFKTIDSSISIVQKIKLTINKEIIIDCDMDCDEIFNFKLNDAMVYGISLLPIKERNSSSINKLFLFRDKSERSIIGFNEFGLCMYDLVAEFKMNCPGNFIVKSFFMIHDTIDFSEYLLDI